MKKIILFVLCLGILVVDAQNCWPPTASINLDVNNVRAKLLNGGDLWWDGVSNAAYEYPKVDTSTGAISENIIFAGALWMTALDENNDLKCAAQTYRNQGHEFWPGPIVFGSNTIPDTECTKFDRFFPILRTELDAHISAVNTANHSLDWNDMSDNIKQWPGKGNIYLQVTYNMNIVDDLAPFEDCNGNGIYDPANGDYPLMKGDQSIFWVINDIGNTHERSGGEPLGVEVQCMAYAYITSNAVNDATFYDYKIIKKTAGDLHDFYFSHYIDPDIGGFTDDYMGCDTVFNYAFAYDFNFPEPIAITQFLKTPNNVGLTSFSYQSNFRNTPSNPIEYNNVQNGKWKDGLPITCGGNGNGGIIPTKLLYPGNPSNSSQYIGDCTDWSECSAGNFADDRRYQMSSGPYQLNATEALEFTIAVMVAETDPNTYTGCPDKTALINPVVNLVNNFIATVDDSPYACKVLSSITDFNDENGLVSIYPNPASDYIILNVSDDFELNKIQIYDIIGAEVNFSISDNMINVSQMSKGVYTLKLYSKKLDRTILKKFVLK